MNSTLQSAYEILSLNTKLFCNTLKNVNQELAERRPNNSTNSIIFIGCHLLDARYYIANLIGLDLICPFQELFDDAQSVDDMKNFPKLKEIKRAWQDLSESVLTQFKHVDDSLLAKLAPITLPTEDNSIMGAITFLAQHDSYHIGQMAFLRKYFGLDAMKYFESET